MTRIDLVWPAVLMVAALVAAGCPENDDSQTNGNGDGPVTPNGANQAPDFSATTLDGETIRLSDYRGKVVVIDFWATWCPPCREAIPKISELAEEYKDRGVVFLGASSESAEKVESFWSREQPAYTAIIVDDSVFGSFGVRGIPTVCIIDQEGALRYREAGYSAEIKSKIANAIDVLLSPES